MKRNVYNVTVVVLIEISRGNLIWRPQRWWFCCANKSILKSFLHLRMVKENRSSFLCSPFLAINWKFITTFVSSDLHPEAPKSSAKDFNFVYATFWLRKSFSFKITYFWHELGREQSVNADCLYACAKEHDMQF